MVSEMCFKLTLSRVVGDYNYGWVIANFKPGAFGRYSCRILMCSASASVQTLVLFVWVGAPGEALFYIPKSARAREPKAEKMFKLILARKPTE